MRIVFTILAFLPTLLLGNEPLIISPEVDDILIKPKHIAVFEDPSHDLDIDSIVKLYNNNHFKTDYQRSTLIQNQNTSSTYWLAFTVRSNQPLTRKYVLENLDPHIQEFEIFKPTIDGYRNELTGYYQPFEEREYAHKNFVFDIPIDTANQTYFIRSNSDTRLAFIFKLRSTNFFMYYALNEYILLGVFYGILAIMIVYNLLVFFSIRDRVYLYYVIYVATCAIVTLQDDGIGFQYIYPDIPLFNAIDYEFAYLLFASAFALYTSSFLNFKRFLPRFYKAFKYIMGLYISFAILDLFFFDYEFVIPHYSVLFLVLYVASIFSYRNGNRYARYYIIAYTIILISIVFKLMRLSFDETWSGIIYVYAFNIGVVIEIVLLSFALGDRLSLLKKDKEEAQGRIIIQLQENEKLKDNMNRELEKQVSQRTRELKERNEELNSVNHQLQEQAKEISKLNSLLESDNIKLQDTLKEQVTARVMSEDIDFDQFNKLFPDKEACLKYLYELKSELGYKCRKCSHDQYVLDETTYSRRCSNCNYIDSPMAYTLFHRLRFPITKAFYMLYLVYAHNGKISSVELSKTLDLRQSTCWKFRKKVLDAMKEKGHKSSKDKGSGWAFLILGSTHAKSPFK